MAYILNISRKFEELSFSPLKYTRGNMTVFQTTMGDKQTKKGEILPFLESN